MKCGFRNILWGNSQFHNGKEINQSLGIVQVGTNYLKEKNVRISL